MLLIASCFLASGTFTGRRGIPSSFYANVNNNGGDRRKGKGEKYTGTCDGNSLTNSKKAFLFVDIKSLKSFILSSLQNVPFAKFY